MALTCKFGKPSHGWLPLDLISDDFHLQDEVSDCPNPIDGLVFALISVLQGKTGELFLLLEPNAYLFSFTPLSDQKIEFRVVLDTDDPQHPEANKRIFSIAGQKSEIVLPFLQAIKEHSWDSYREHDWPECDGSALEELRALLEDE